MEQHSPDDALCLKHIPFFSIKGSLRAQKGMGTSNLQLFEVAEEGDCATQIGLTATDARVRDSKSEITEQPDCWEHPSYTRDSSQD